MQGKKLSNDVLSHFILSSIGVLSQLMLVPLYIRAFGEQGYSRLSIIFSICAFVLVSDYGVYLAASSQIIKIYKDHKYFSLKIWNQYSKYVTIASTCIAPILFIFFLHSNESSPVLWQDLEFKWIIFIIFMASTAISLIQHALLIKFQLIDNFGLGLRYLAYLRIFEVTLHGIALYFKINLISFAILAIFIKSLNTFIFWIFTHQILKIKKPNLIYELNEKESFILKDVSGKATFNFTNLLGLHGNILIASLWITQDLLFYTLIARMITSPIRYLADSLINGGLPRLTTYFRELKNLPLHKERKPLNLIMITSLFTLFLFFCIGTLLISPLLWNLLSFGNHEYPQALVIAFLFSTSLDSAAAVISMLAIAQNKSNKIQYFYLFSVLISFGLQFGLRNILMEFAMPLSLAIGDLIFIFFVIIGNTTKRFVK
jgi:O-antigen/teichoic acid export membrane protein